MCLAIVYDEMGELMPPRMLHIEMVDYQSQVGDEALYAAISFVKTFDDLSMVAHGLHHDLRIVI